MDTEHPAINDSGQGKEVEDLTTRLPDGRVAVLGLTLLVEAVHLGDLSRLVVSAHQSHSVGESAPSRQYDMVGREHTTYLAFKHINSVKVSRLK